MSDGMRGPEFGCGGALGRSGSGDRILARGEDPSGLCRPGDLFALLCGVDGKPPTPRRICGVFIAPEVDPSPMSCSWAKRWDGVRWNQPVCFAELGCSSMVPLPRRRETVKQNIY